MYGGKHDKVIPQKKEKKVEQSIEEVLSKHLTPLATKVDRLTTECQALRAKLAKNDIRFRNMGNDMQRLMNENAMLREALKHTNTMVVETLQIVEKVKK